MNPRTNNWKSEPVVRRVRLRTRKGDRLAAFYTRLLGLEAQADEEGDSILHLKNTKGAVLVTLEEDPKAVEPEQGSHGLFHIAFVVENKEEWKTLVANVIRGEAQYHGSSDHGVSWAAYFSDPDGNGIEIAWDKPFDDWTWNGDQVQKSTRYLDLDLPSNQTVAGRIPLEIGHIHLSLGNLDAASSYCEQLNLRVTQSDFPGAMFMARGEYHHHLAINTWGKAAAGHRTENAVGLNAVDWFHPGRKQDSWTDSIGIQFNFCSD